MRERYNLKDTSGMLGRIQKTRQVIDILTKHTSFSGEDAAELLGGLDRLEAETVQNAPQVQTAGNVVSLMRKKGYISEEQAARFSTLLEDPETARILRKDLHIEPDQEPQATSKTATRRRFLLWEDLTPRPADIVTGKAPPPVTSPGSTVTQRRRIGRRGLMLGGAALALGGLTTYLSIDYYLYYMDKIAWYRDGLTWKIKETPFRADELPPGWVQLKTYDLQDPDPDWSGTRTRHSGPSVSEICIDLGNGLDTAMICFVTYVSSEAARVKLETYEEKWQAVRPQWPDDKKRPRQKRIEHIYGIGDIAVFDRSYHQSDPNHPNPSELDPSEKYEVFAAAVDRVTFYIGNGNGNPQKVLSLASATIKYLARLGVTSKKP